MKRKIKNKDAAHLQIKMALYECFLYHYLPQISTLSHITRLNIFDLFGQAGLGKLGTQGTPFTIYHALYKQRQHQLKNKLILKPYSLNVLSLQDHNAFPKGMELLEQENKSDKSCRLDSLNSTFGEGIKKIASQLRQQAASEKNLIFLDPLGVVALSLRDLELFADKKAELIIYLPLKRLWQLHSKPEKAHVPEELSQLKQSLDQLFPEGHGYWSEEIKPAEFFIFLKEAYRLQGDFYTAMEPADKDVPEGVLLTLSSDAYMMEKMLHALQALRPVNAIPPGAQIPLFNAEPSSIPAWPNAQAVLELITEEIDNQKLYEAGLQKGLLPAQLEEGVNYLVNEGKIGILDQKGKPLQKAPTNCMRYTAFKASAPVCFFQKTGAEEIFL